MDVPSTFGARRICHLAGRPFWVRPCDWLGWAEIVAWLDDVLPGRADRDTPPRLADDASQEALRSEPGRALLAWIATRDSGVGYEEAAALWGRADDDERYRLLSVLMGRRRSLSAESDGSDLGETWCGKGLAQLGQAIGMDALARLTLDQTEWLLSEGECDRHADPAARSRIDVQRQWEEARRRWEEEQGAAGGAAPSDVGGSAEEH